MLVRDELGLISLGVDSFIKSCIMAVINHLFTIFLDQFDVIAVKSTLNGGGGGGSSLMEKGLYVEV